MVTFFDDVIRFYDVAPTNPTYCADSSNANTGIDSPTLIEFFGKDSLCFDYVSDGTSDGYACLQYKYVRRRVRSALLELCVKRISSATNRTKSSFSGALELNYK